MESKYTKQEIRLISGISLLMAIRMLGISLIIPLFSIFATTIPGSSLQLAGVAVGIFGAAQICFLIPMGKLSDKIGMKQVTLFGLAIYFFGSLFSGLSGNIYHLIISRFIAGAGAVSGVTMAWITGGVRLEKRNRAMSFVGMSIGTMAISGFGLSAVIGGNINIPVLFYICAAMTLVAALYTSIFLKNNELPTHHDPEDEVHLDKKSIIAIFSEPDLIRINLAGCISSIALTAIFFAMPLLLKNHMHIKEMWKFYVPMGIIGTTFMFFLSREADRRGTRSITLVGLSFEIIGFTMALSSVGPISLFGALIIFYSGHCILSPILPVAISKYPGKSIKGTTMSVFYSCMYTGSSIGGVVSGFLFDYDHSYLFGLVIFLLIVSWVGMLGYTDYGRKKGYS